MMPGQVVRSKAALLLFDPLAGLPVRGLWTRRPDPSSVLVPVGVLTPCSVYGCRYGETPPC